MDYDCQKTFYEDSAEFVCKKEICYNRSDLDFWDSDGFCVKTCDEEKTVLDEDRGVCDPQCEENMNWNPRYQRCLYYIN